MATRPPIKSQAIRDRNFEPGSEAYEQQNAARQQINSDTTVDRNITGLSRVSMGHVKKWDPVTANNLALLERNMTLNPAKRAWVVNLHPWPIAVNGGRMMRETVPPAGLELFSEGDLLLHRHRIQGEGETVEYDRNGVSALEIPWYEPDMKPEENGSYSVLGILPIEQAGEYAREGNSNDLWGPGVIIYDGDSDPDEMWRKNADVSLFGPTGKPIVTPEVTKVQKRGQRNPVDEVIDAPVTGKFRDVINGINQQRLARYMAVVNEANAYFVSSEGKEKKWYTSRNTAFMAQVLFKLKRLKELPSWAIETDLTAPAAVEKCIVCGTERKPGAMLCTQEGWPFDAFAAYTNEPPLIAFEHVAIQNLPIEQLKKVYKLKATRDKNRELAMAGEAK